MSITVEVRKGNLEQAMRVLKKKVQKEGIIKDYRAKSVLVEQERLIGFRQAAGKLTRVAEFKVGQP